MKTRLVLAAVTLTALLVPAVSAASTSDTLDWGQCPDGVTGTGLECATLDVPLDYRDPDGQTIRR
jgi:hypothetical protein